MFILLHFDGDINQKIMFFLGITHNLITELILYLPNKSCAKFAD